MGQVRTSQDIPGCEGTFETWDCGHCSRWDKSGHPGTSWDILGCEGTSETWDLGIVLGGISQDIPGHLRPGTLDIVLDGTSQDIPGCEGTFETWDFGHCPRWDKSGYPGM